MQQTGDQEGTDGQRDNDYLSNFVPPPNSEVPCLLYQHILLRDMQELFGSVNQPTPTPFQNDAIPTGMTEPSPGTELGNATRESRVAEEMIDARPSAAHSCLATMPCHWTTRTDGKSKVCGAKMTCKTVPAHFRDAHSIKNVTANAQIHCRWEGCDKLVGRKNFTRHVREHHVHHHRVQKSKGVKGVH
ncbi:hypothetical protein JVU11DRAFT_7758 [Chiua virens]|nr:hypothetical protein JVU11DRAFT_7758 [Chiua virens]